MGDSSKHILCVGLICLDIVVTCEQFPSEDSDQRCISHHWSRGGNASNTCTVLNELGVSCELLGTLAKDLGGIFLKQDLEEYTIPHANCPLYDAKESPITSAIINQHNGSRTLLHSNRNLPELPSSVFKTLDLSKYSWIHFEGRNVKEMLHMVDHIHHFNTNQSSSHIGVSIELEKSKTELIELLECPADTFIIGRPFAQMMGAVSKEQALEIISKRYGSKSQIVCPWGEEGAIAQDVDGNKILCEAFKPLQIKDTLGAGDSFIAGLIASLYSGRTLETSLTTACRVAGQKCGQVGFKDLGKCLPSNIV